MPTNSETVSLDAGSLNSGSVSLRAGSPGSVSVAVSRIGGRQAVIFKIHNPDTQGSLTPLDGEKLKAAAQMACQKRLPLVGYIASSGADVPSGIPAVYNWGEAARALVACSGVVPTIFCATGPVVSGPALLFGIADITIMLPDTYAFVSGPAMVEIFTGMDTDSATLGGVNIHRTQSGVTSFVADGLDEADELIRELLALLPSHNGELAPRLETQDAPSRSIADIADVLPSETTGSYDMKHILKSVVDDGYLLEVREHWAPNMITAFATLGGRPVGLVANQPQVLAGTLNIAASQKAARFVRFCDAFNLPLITFVDTPGFQPGKDLEWRGMIRHGAQMAFAYAEATVPRICVTIRKSYGGAYIVMDSKYMGNDLALAWPSAEVAVMGAKGAVGILHRKEPEESRAQLEKDYAQKFLAPYLAAERGSIDQIIDPAHTRAEVVAALELLESKRESLPLRRHDNTPL